MKTYTHDEVLKLLRAQAAADATRVEDADDGVPLGCLADAIRAASLVLDAEPEVTESDEHGLRLRCRDLRARVAELEDDFAKRQASHCCPTWNDQMEDCDCDERMGGHIARWQEAEAEVARLREALQKYGGHQSPCFSAVWCDCGYSAALASAPSAAVVAKAVGK